ncbi:MAG: 8-amino-7-oxononanoate synthase [Verrucomicrobiota bacterium]|nr:8-amino-7-oxononanoate synthase [Limisphaera sp.]MDW8382401.1 8-amino-7-oxononanoate synthase [Verrucomicrobiota bacterium]
MKLSLDDCLRDALTQQSQQGLLRQLMPVTEVDGRLVRQGEKLLVNFSSNDYLGLARHPKLQEAALQAVRDWGTGSTASRLICGSLQVHHLLEEQLAAYKGTAAALIFSTGHAAAMGTVPALVGREDIVILDRLAHACLVDAARLSGAALRVFRHNDLNDLERLLRWADDRRTQAARQPRPLRILVVTESVFSMDGDQAPLAAIVELKDRYGAWLMVDEAHATGLFGPRGEGLIAAAGLTQRVEIQMGTLGKALGSAGGFIAGSRPLIDWLIQAARTFMFSTAPTPSQSAVAATAVQLVQSAEGTRLRAQLWKHVHQATRMAVRGDLQWPGLSLPPSSAILPWVAGESARALACAETARQMGLLIPAIRYPAVPRHRARLRITISAAHLPEDLALLERFLLQIAGASLTPTPAPRF